MNGAEIKAARQRLNLKQAELAEKAGVTQSMLSMVETGAAVPSLDTLNRIAGALGLQVTISFTQAPAQEEPAVAR